MLVKWAQLEVRTGVTFSMQLNHGQDYSLSREELQSLIDQMADQDLSMA